VDGAPDIAFNLQRVEEGVAVHLIRYDYDEESDAVPLLDALDVSVRLQEHFDTIECFDPGCRLSASLSREADTHTLSLRNVPLYSIVLLRHG
jgi:hypothetical protein